MCRYQSTMNSRIVWKVSAAIWTFSFVMAFVPIHLGWNTLDGKVQNVAKPRECALGHNGPYVLTVALGTYFLPLLIVCGVSVRVLQITRQQVGQAYSVKSLQCMGPTEYNRECIIMYMYVYVRVLQITHRQVGQGLQCVVEMYMYNCTCMYGYCR